MCWYCGSPVLAENPIGRSARCPDCGKDLRCCKHCRFYKVGAHWDCAETIDASVADKTRGNFCDWFSLDPRFREAGTADPSKKSASSAKSAFDSLFGD